MPKSVRSTDATQRRWWVFGSIGVAAMTALAIWFGIAATSGRVDWVDTGNIIVSDEQVDVRFDLNRDPSRAVRCEVIAQDYNFNVVGRAEVVVPPTDSSPSRHLGSVETVAPAVSGKVDTCSYVDAPG